MNRENLPADPLAWFRRWHEEAKAALPDTADIMALATTDEHGPSVRFVHFKGMYAGELVFYTNYGSRKALQLAANSAAAVAFHWQRLGRQVRIEGRCSRLERHLSERYFAERDRESQLSSLASRQSEPLSSFDTLDAEIEAFRFELAGKAIACPADWGGMQLRASRVELWESHTHRRHRRYEYLRDGDAWSVRLLYP